MNAEVLKCSCEHKGQDLLHGFKMRVFNFVTKKKTQNSVAYKCTVCGSETYISSNKKV